MAKSLDAVIAGLPRDQQKEIAAESARLIQGEMTLRDLRKAHQFTKRA
jgi:hypothetical protein